MRKLLRIGNRAIAIAAGVSLWLMPAPPLYAQDARQYKIEAAFLYNFFNYITWPGFASPKDLKEPVVCLYGNDPVQPYLEYVRRKVEQERTLTIRKIENEDGLDGCNLLFTRLALPERVREAAHNARVLIVSNQDVYGGQEGMIDLKNDGERIAIKIDHSLLDADGFQVSSRLLNLASKVD